MMLPIPFSKYIPKIFKQGSKFTALANKADTHLTEWKNDIIRLKRQIRPDECDSNIISELGELLHAGINVNDSELVRRQKVAGAVAAHKVKNLWVNVKAVIDAQTGYSCAKVIESPRSDWIMVGNSVQGTEYVGSLGYSDPADTSLGLDLYGSSDEFSHAGNIFINLHPGTTTSVLTLAQVKAVYTALNDYMRLAYLRIFLGYVNGSGNFVRYDLMEVFSISTGPVTKYLFIGEEFWIVNGSSNTLKIYAVSTGTLLSTITSSDFASFSIDMIVVDNNLIVVTNFKFLTISISSRAIIKTNNNSMGAGGSVVYLSGYLYSLIYGGIVKINASSFDVVSSFALAYFINELFTDGSSLYVSASGGSPSLNRILKFSTDLNFVNEYANLPIFGINFSIYGNKAYFGDSDFTTLMGIFDFSTETFNFLTLDYSTSSYMINVDKNNNLIILKQSVTQAVIKYDRKRQRILTSGGGGYTALQFYLTTRKNYIAFNSAIGTVKVLYNFDLVIGDPL